MNPTNPAPVVEAYLNFEGRCEEAVEFYKSALGAEVLMLLRFKDAPKGEDCGPSQDHDQKIMHSSIRIGNTTIMASDCRNTGKASFEGFSLAISVKTEAEANQYFAALSAGGKVVMPLDKTFWSPRFGVVSDKFGVSWMVSVAGAPQ